MTVMHCKASRWAYECTESEEGRTRASRNRAAFWANVRFASNKFELDKASALPLIALLSRRSFEFLDLVE